MNSNTETRSYFKFAPGAEWNRFYNENIAALGFKYLDGDLINYKNSSELNKAANLPSGNDSTQSLLIFRDEAKIGDVVFASRGQNVCIGIGIIESNHRYNNDKTDNYKHWRKIKWITNEEYEYKSDQQLFSSHVFARTEYYDLLLRESAKSYPGLIPIFKENNLIYNYYWVGASYYGLPNDQKDMFDDFIENSYWGTDHDLGGKEGLKIYKELKKVQIGDKICIRYLDKKNSKILIPVIGTITDIANIKDGELGVLWDSKSRDYKGLKPSGTGSGNWWKTLFQLKRHSDIVEIFGDMVFEKRIARNVGQKESDFEFMPSIDDGEDDPKTKTHHRQPIQETEIIERHETISKSLTKLLRQTHGKNVTREHIAGVNKIDIVVNQNNDLTFYEIKTYDSIKTSIREALGQLMEYCFYPNKKNASELIIVTEMPADEQTKIYFQYLRNNFNLHIYYQSYNLETKTLSEKC